MPIEQKITRSDPDDALNGATVGASYKPTFDSRNEYPFTNISFETTTHSNGEVSPSVSIGFKDENTMLQASKQLEIAGYKIKDTSLGGGKSFRLEIQTLAGDEAYPPRITQNDFLKITDALSSGGDPAKGIYPVFKPGVAAEIELREMERLNISAVDAGMVSFETMDSRHGEPARFVGVEGENAGQYLNTRITTPESQVTSLSEDSVWATNASGKPAFLHTTTLETPDGQETRVADALNASGIKAGVKIDERYSLNIPTRDAERARAVLTDGKIGFIDPKTKTGSSEIKINFNNPEELRDAERLLVRSDMRVSGVTSERYVRVIAEAPSDAVATALGKDGIIPNVIAQEIAAKAEGVHPGQTGMQTLTTRELSAGPVGKQRPIPTTPEPTTAPQEFVAGDSVFNRNPRETGSRRPARPQYAGMDGSGWPSDGVDTPYVAPQQANGSVASASSQSKVVSIETGHVDVGKATKPGPVLVVRSGNFSEVPASPTPPIEFPVRAPSSGASPVASAFEEGAMPAMGESAGALSKTLGVGGFLILGAAMPALRTLGHGGSAPQIANAAAFGVADAALGTGNIPVITNESGEETGVDRTLGAARMATTALGTGAFASMVASGGVDSPVAGPVVVGAFVVNGVLGGLQDVAHVLHLAHDPGVFEQTDGMLKAMRAENLNTGPCGELGAHADAEMYRAMSPVYDVSGYLSRDPGLKGKIPALAIAMDRFNESRFESTTRRIETGAAFAHQLAKDLRERGPEGDAVREALAPILLKADMTTGQYADALNVFARDMDTIDGRMKHAQGKEYTQVVTRAVVELGNSMNGGPPVVPETPAWLKPGPLLVPTKSTHGDFNGLKAHTTANVAAHDAEESKQKPAQAAKPVVVPVGTPAAAPISSPAATHVPTKPAFAAVP